jgi:hypothetical protein
MTTIPKASRTVWLQWLLYAFAGLVGLKYGYDFGDQISGKLLGFVLGLNSAAFGIFFTQAFIGPLFDKKENDPNQP